MTQKEPIKLTLPQRKALEIVQEFGPIRPREFARKMWPDSRGWRRSARCGPNGSHRGGGMYLAGGGYLGKLCRKGWIRDEYEQVYSLRRKKFELWRKGYTLTSEGRKALEEDKERQRSEG